jgi:hypothetical protein
MIIDDFLIGVAVCGLVLSLDYIRIVLRSSPVS